MRQGKLGRRRYRRYCGRSSAAGCCAQALWSGPSLQGASSGRALSLKVVIVFVLAPVIHVVFIV